VHEEDSPGGAEATGVEQNAEVDERAERRGLPPVMASSSENISVVANEKQVLLRPFAS
jgi:hypothetical protein